MHLALPRFHGISILALLFTTAAMPALAQTSATTETADLTSQAPVRMSDLEAKILAIDKEVTAAEAEMASYGEGLVSTLIQARVETLKLTRAILTNQIAAAEGGAVTEITGPVGAPDEARAVEILKDIETQMTLIEQAEVEAAGAGGLVAALALSRVQTEKLTLASLRSAWMAATYGSILPVAAPAVPATAAPAPSAASEDSETATPGSVERPEWADPEHPEIDYTKQIFTELDAEGYEIHGWWGLLETRAEIDDTPVAWAMNVSAFQEGFMPTNPALHISCREGTASVVYDTATFLMGDYSTSTMPTSYRIDDEPAQTGNWGKLTSSKGTGLFDGSGEDMMRRLYDAEKIFLRIEDRGTRHDATFDLAGIKPVIDAVAAACSFSLLDLTTDDYRAIQTMLNAAGLDAGTPDGVWGEGSATAMRQWQAQNGLTATGAPDRATLEAMGVGPTEG